MYIHSSPLHISICLMSLLVDGFLIQSKIHIKKGFLCQLPYTFLHPSISWRKEVEDCSFLEPVGSKGIFLGTKHKNSW